MSLVTASSLAKTYRVGDQGHRFRRLASADFQPALRLQRKTFSPSR
jgi:hypothetical protein